MGPLLRLSEWTNETIGCGDGGTFKKGDNTMEKPNSSWWQQIGHLISDCPPPRNLIGMRFRFAWKSSRIRSEFHRLRLESVRERGDEATRFRNVGIWKSWVLDFELYFNLEPANLIWLWVKVVQSIIEKCLSPIRTKHIEIALPCGENSNRGPSFRTPSGELSD